MTSCAAGPAVLGAGDSAVTVTPNGVGCAISAVSSSYTRTCTGGTKGCNGSSW